MAKKHISTGQIRELLELDTRGDGLGEYVQELITRVSSGGLATRLAKFLTPSLIREMQAKRYWDLGVGRELGYKSFKEYLASIPNVPEGLCEDDDAFPLLILIESRIGRNRLCTLANVTYAGDLAKFVSLRHQDPDFQFPTWIRVQDGRKHVNESVNGNRRKFVKNELGLTLFQGICTYLQNDESIVGSERTDAHGMYFPESVHADDLEEVACLVLQMGRLEIVRMKDYMPVPGCGSASRRVS